MPSIISANGVRVTYHRLDEGTTELILELDGPQFIARIGIGATLGTETVKALKQLLKEV